METPVVVAKYDILRCGGEILSPNPCSSLLWKRIASSWELFCGSSGDNILFWSNSWIGRRPLAIEFSDFFGVLETYLPRSLLTWIGAETKCVGVLF